MSQRGKRQPTKTDDGPVPTKRRKCRPTAAEEEEAAAALAAASGSGSWTPRPVNDLKISSIYNRSATETPAELFRKDLISAMKLPDSEPLASDEYWVITDQWKQEWERGVQVPVNPDSLPEPMVTVNHSSSRERGHHFKLPKSKYVRITKDEFFTTDQHYLSNMPAKAEKACAYDLDDTDAAWLKVLNGERAAMGLPSVNEDQLERVIEQLEIRCWEKVQTIVKTEEGLGIEFDENVICDVCRSPDSEEGNEMVFCDCCNICVHQACYGITTIPSGSWLCRTCALGQRPECVLCPNKGGAMKCTRSGQKWAHVSCALWIPEVSIGCVERMEPITKISSIPQSRWALICVLCRERVGACIQCSVKTCKTAYHVTCAFKHGLEMKAIIEDENADDGVKLRSYCQKHSVKKEKCGSQSEDEESRRRKRKDMTSEEKNQARAAKLQEIEAEFDKHVSIKDVPQTMDVDMEGVHHIYNYWKLKRKAGFNRPLLPPRSEDVDILSRQQEQADIEKMKNFVQLRQDLERVRNLCYMVSRREKLSRTFFRMREQTFHKQVAVLTDTSYVLKTKEVAAVIQANHGPSIYDRLYSQPSAEEAASHFDVVLARIAGIASPSPVEEKVKVDLNGLVKRPEKSSENPYKRMYYNGSGRRRSSLYGSSASETDSTRRQSSSSQDEGNVGNSASATKIVSKKRTKKSVVPRTRTDASTSEDDEKPAKNVWQAPRNRTLRQMEREMNSASEDSEELLPMKPTKSEHQKIASIYSDSDSEPSKGSASEEDKAPSDSQQHVLRTKAAMKEFSAGLQAKVDRPTQKTNKVSRSAKSVSDKSITRDDSMDDDSTKDKENVKSTKKVEYDPSDLIVPQRQAAKKASESIRCSQGKSKEQILFEQEALKTSPVSEDQKIKQKNKHKMKEFKEGKSGDIYDFEKDINEADTPEILAYVPQRQAAKKAAQHIKSGMTKPLPGAVEVENTESGKVKKDLPDVAKPKKEVDISKISKKDIDADKLKRSRSPETKSKTPVKSREIVSTSTSSSSSGSDSSSSDSESDDKSKTFKREKVEKKEVSPHKEPEKKPKRIPGKSEDWPFLDKGDQSSHSSSSSGGSDSSDDSDVFTRKKEESISPNKNVPKGKEGSASKHVGKKFTKAPDKKLKTSDGRPEPEFQPPFLERDEPSRTKESVGRSRKAGTSTSDRVGNTDGRSRDLLVSPGRGQGRDSSTSSGDRPRAPRTSEQLPDSDGRKHRKEQSKSEGGKRKPGEVYSGDTSISKETSKSGQLSSIKKADKKVALSDNKLDVKIEKREGKDLVSVRLDSEPTDRKLDRSTNSKKSSKILPDKSLDKRNNKSEKDISKRSSERSSKSPVPRKVSLKDEATPKHKQSVPKDSHKKLSHSQDISSKRALKEHDLFGTEDLVKKNKSSDRDVGSKGSKHNVTATGSAPKSPSKDSKESSARKADITNAKQREEKLSSPKKDNRLSAEEKRPSLDLTDTTTKREKEIRRESTESIASVSTDAEDDKSNKKAKPMPRCKKEALGILGENKEETEMKVDVLEEEKALTPGVVLPSEQINPPQEVVEIVQEIIPSTKQMSEPEVPAEQQNKPEVQRPIGTFRPIPQLEKTDPVEELPVPDAEPQKITSRTSSLYQQRSIFSPQQPKDPAVAELFDFENDILAVDDSVNDDGFSMARDTDELIRPLTFSFSSEFFFKEESKEDSERETLNLVEKLRLEYAKKTTTGSGQGDGSSVGVDDEEAAAVIEEKPPELPEVEIVEPPKPTELKEPSPCEASIGGPRSMESCAVESKVLPASTPIPSSQLEPQDIPLKVPPYTDYEYNSCNVPVSMPGREKLDRSNSDERWVPPSGMEFVHQRMHHYETHPPDTPAPSPYTDLQSRAKWADSEVLPVRRSSSSSASSSSSSSHREDMELQKRDELLYSSVAELYQGVHQAIPSFPQCALDVHAYHSYQDASQFVGPVALFPPTCPQLPYPSPGAAMYPPPFGPPFSTAQLLQPVPKPPEEPPHIPPPCGAAFTSSSHNIALTAAIVSPPPQVPTPTPVLHTEPIPVSTEPLHLNQQSLSLEPEPLPSEREPEPIAPPETVVNHDIVKESPTPKPAANPPGKKSPTKPTRTSARVTSQLSKSPGKSPRQQEVPAKSPARVRDTGSKRGKGSSNRGGHGQNRGGSRRGRGRGRGSMHYQDVDYNTIRSKLAGTVYDLEFDDDSPSEGVESMRAMRERRRSSDHHERKIGLDYASQDMSQSPKFGTSPHQNSKLRYGMESRDLRPPTPVTGRRTPADEELMPPPSPLATTDRIESFPDVVRPLLPGPVDMRTYSSTEYEPSPATNPATYHNHLLGPFSTAATDHHETDIAEEIDKELNTALAASKSSSEIKAEEIKIADVTAVNDDSVSQIKVSLSDSRNQLKVKIKGPFLDANYSASSVSQQQVVLPIPPDVAAAASVIPVTATNAFNVGSSTGTSNLRRMRKKELLRQYCSQDMNMIDPAGGPMLGGVAPPTTTPPVSRTVITIPKAVASMTTIPTREDYKAVVDANMEKKRRKEKALSSSLSGPRELRHLDLTVGLEEPDLPERRRSVGSTGSNGSVQFDVSSHPVKRRGRPAKPVLKIKIGNSVIPEESNEEKRLRVRPPKKRLSSVPMPSMEEMKRESMKFRKMIMADLKQEEKKRNKSISGKRRKKHSDQRHEVRIVTGTGESEQTSGTKLIIRFNKCASGEPPEDPGGGRTSLPAGPQETLPPDKDKPVTVPVSTPEKTGPSPLLNVRTSKMSPIRLKLARCHEGYVMKKPLLDPIAPVSEPSVSVNDSEQSVNNSSASSSVPVNQGCEVR